MDLNFRGTKLSRIEIFRIFCVFIFAGMLVPQYYIEYIDYISVLICASHISHVYREVCLGCAKESE